MMLPKLSVPPTIASIAFVVLVGCGHSEPAPRVSTAPERNPSPSSLAPGALAERPWSTQGESQPSQDSRMTDAHVLAIVRTIAATEIEQARLARDMASFAKVRQYADRMVGDHGDVNAKADHVSQKTSLSPQPSATSNSLDADGKQDTLDLGTKRGADFDRTYLTSQIRNHEAVLQTIDTKLLPNVRSSDLRSLVDSVRTKVARQLVDARDLLAKLDGQ